MALILFFFLAVAQGQTSQPSGTNVPAGTTSEASSSVSAVGSEQEQTPAKPGNLVGTILDQSGSVAVGAVVRVTSENKSFTQEVISGNNGQFSFSNVPAGHFDISVNSAGFSNEAFSGELAPGQTYLLPAIVLSIATVVTDVRAIDADPVEVATEQVKEQEHQRVFGFVPNFYVTYHPDAPPLTTKLKFHLAYRSSTDPINIFGIAFLAGLEQAGGQYGEFGGGALGYGKRFGAAYADVAASTFLSGAVFPTLFKQDPRYFYKGTGSTNSRIWRAAGNAVMCKGDNGHWQVNYSNIAGVFGGAALSSTFYPTNNRGLFTLTGGFIRLGESSLAGVFQEFVARRLTKTSRRQGMPPDSVDALTDQNSSVITPRNTR